MTGINTNNICYVPFTDQPFVVANTKYTPTSNLSVNDTINVTVFLKACGWINATNYNNSAILVFDTSGSMDWLANTIYPGDGGPQQGTIDKAASSLCYLTVNTLLIPRTGSQLSIILIPANNSQNMQIVLSSNYRAYYNGSLYQLRVIDPNGIAYETDNNGNTSGNVIAISSQNENSVMFTTTSGTYQIPGAYIYNSSAGKYTV